MSPTAKFQPSKYKDQAIRDLESGMSPKEVAAKYGISIRTAFRYQGEVPTQGRPQPTSRSSYLTEAEEVLLIDAVIQNPQTNRALLKALFRIGFHGFKGGPS